MYFNMTVCNICGLKLPHGIRVCGTCGTIQQAISVPDYEFKTVICAENSTEEVKFKHFYERCGWQITDMQRQSDLRVDYCFDTKPARLVSGKTLEQNKTHIIMQRDQNMPDYNLIRQKSAIAEAQFLAIPPLKTITPAAKVAAFIFLLLGFFLLIGATAAMLTLHSPENLGFLIGIPIMVAGVLALIISIIVVSVARFRKIKAHVQYMLNQKEADLALNICHEALERHSVNILKNNNYHGKPWL